MAKKKFLNCLATLRTIAKHNDHFSILSSSNNSSGSSYIDSDEISKIIHVCYTAYNSQLKFVHKFNYDLDTIIAANSFINILSTSYKSWLYKFSRSVTLLPYLSAKLDDPSVVAFVPLRSPLTITLPFELMSLILLSVLLPPRKS